MRRLEKEMKLVYVEEEEWVSVASLHFAVCIYQTSSLSIWIFWLSFFYKVDHVGNFYVGFKDLDFYVHWMSFELGLHRSSWMQFWHLDLICGIERWIWIWIRPLNKMLVNCFWSPLANVDLYIPHGCFTNTSKLNFHSYHRFDFKWNKNPERKMKFSISQLK